MGTARQSSAASDAATPAWSLAASRDRISSTLFLAALLHGIVILGVTFGGISLDNQPATSLDVVLVVDTADSPNRPEDARVLAQSNLDGAGNTSEQVPLQTAAPRNAADALPGPEQAGSDQPQRRGATSDAPLVTTVAADSLSSRTDDLGETVEQMQRQRTALPGDSANVELIDEATRQTLISDPDPRELVISARTQESRIAAYLSNWKRKVERVGTLNFPRQTAARNADRFPTLEVAISADGQLQEVVVLNSSGERVLDDAATEILRIAAPFDPFPDFLRTDYDVLRFAYEWRFGPDAGVQRLTARSSR